MDPPVACQDAVGDTVWAVTVAVAALQSADGPGKHARMKWTRFFIPTTKETPADAVVASHRLKHTSQPL